MALWLLFALMTAAAIFAVLWPLGRVRVPQGSANDLAVYRDQLDEIVRDQSAGLIGAAEAEAARVEVSRRLLGAAEAAASEPSAPGGTLRRRVAAVAALVAVPLVAAGLYLTLGSPELPGQPLASRDTTPLQDRSLDRLVANVESHLEKNPDDGRGWEVVGPVYMRLGRFDDAVKARRNSLRINGPSADREADLGESLMAQANGVVTDEAKAAFERVLTHDLKNLKARFFLGVAAHQDGETAKATDIWRGMLQDARPDSPWIGMVREALAGIEGTSEAASAQQPAPGPNAEDVAAAEQMKPEDRNAMVRGMVDRLAERLKRDGSDLEGWLRLVRAYVVMGDLEKAKGALSDARQAVAGDAERLRQLNEGVKTFGLDG